MGQLLATLPTCAHLSPDSQARLHRAGSVPCKPKTLKMSAYGNISLRCATPRVLPTPWALPTLQPSHVAGAGKPPAPCTTDRGNASNPRPPTRLLRKPWTGFQPVRFGFLLPHGDGEGVRATKSCILP